MSGDRGEGGSLTPMTRLSCMYSWSCLSSSGKGVTVWAGMGGGGWG